MQRRGCHKWELLRCLLCRGQGAWNKARLRAVPYPSGPAVLPGAQSRRRCSPLACKGKRGASVVFVVVLWPDPVKGGSLTAVCGGSCASQPIPGAKGEEGRVGL